MIHFFIDKNEAVIVRILKVGVIKPEAIPCPCEDVRAETCRNLFQELAGQVIFKHHLLDPIPNPDRSVFFVKAHIIKRDIFFWSIAQTPDPADKLAISPKQPDSAHPFVQNHYVVVVHLKFVNLANECVADSLKGNDFLEISNLTGIEIFI